MRAIIASLILVAVATPAAAQVVPPNLNAIEAQDFRFRLDSLERSQVRQSNELMAQEAQARANNAVSDLQIQRDFPPSVPDIGYTPQLPAPSAGPLKYPSVPDAALADSNRRVQAAAGNRR